MRRLLPFLLVLAALPAFANLDVTVRVDTGPYKGKSLDMQSVGEPEPATHVTALLTLGATFFRYENDAKVTIFDFATRRVYVTDAKGTMQRSLFADAAGAVAELDNRVFLAELNKSARTAAIPVVVSEHELSMLANKGAEPVDRSEKKDRIVFRGKKLELADFSKETIDVTDAQRDAFVRFLLHTFGEHPVIMKALLRQKGIPRELHIVQHTSGLDYRITVLDVKQSPDEPYAPPANPQLEIESDATLGPIAVKALHGVPFSVKAKASAEVTAYLVAGKSLDAFLAALEFNMTEGQVPLPQLTDPRMKADPNVRLLASSLSPRTAKEARASLALLARLHAIATDKSYVLSIYEGDMHTNFREVDEAHAKFVEVLTKNPYITGAWADFGDMFHRHYNAVTAWDCWTIARRLNAQHPLLQQVDEQETSLLSDHPEFF